MLRSAKKHTRSAQGLLVISAGRLFLIVALCFGPLRLEFQKRAHPIERAKPDRSKVSTNYIEPHKPLLHITGIVQHGRIIEVKGTADAGSIVMINGQPAATIFNENAFRHFVGPLPTGTTIVSVTCQDEQGDVDTQQLAITLD